jgi:hypothetical protein
MLGVLVQGVSTYCNYIQKFIQRDSIMVVVTERRVKKGGDITILWGLCI